MDEEFCTDVIGIRSFEIFKILVKKIICCIGKAQRNFLLERLKIVCLLIIFDVSLILRNEEERNEGGNRNVSIGQIFLDEGVHTSQ